MAKLANVVQRLGEALVLPDEFLCDCEVGLGRSSGAEECWSEPSVSSCFCLFLAIDLPSCLSGMPECHGFQLWRSRMLRTKLYAAAAKVTIQSTSCPSPVA